MVTPPVYIKALTRYKVPVKLPTSRFEGQEKGSGMSSSRTTDPVIKEPAELESRCGLLRALHVPGDPIVLPNAWDVASAKAVEAAGFPGVATTSGGVAASLGYDDHEGAPAAEMLAAAARIARSVDVPVTVDAESGYGMAPDELVTALRQAGAAGCNLEDT